MGSYTHHQSFEQPNPALLRFRSAPSSLFSGFFESSESERLGSRFGNCGCGGGGESESPAAGNYCSDMSGCFSLLGSNLGRQSSTPALVFSQFNQSDYGGGSFNNGGEEGSPSSNRLNSEISFTSLLPSSLGMLSQISQQVNNVKLAKTKGEAQFFTSSAFPFTSWNESSQFSESFPGVKRDQDSNSELFFSSNQNGENGNRVHSLLHHLSLPKNVTDITSIEKLLQLQDSVPCQIRAKRGCATHPRSIAERNRRTRISERMRKLQELVPNMDKQMNTSDMLDLAVDYIKELQKQFKTLRDNRMKCVCLNMQKPVSNKII